MSLFSKLFGGGAKHEAEPVEYEGFRIFAEPIKETGGHRVAARIEKEIGGEVKTHQMIRADQCQSKEEARQISVAKAKMLIDEQGDSIFG